MQRSPSAPLSPAEFASLRQLAVGLTKTVPAPHIELLLKMDLIERGGFDGFVLTDQGRRRLPLQDPKSRGLSEVEPIPHRDEQTITM